VLAGASSAMPTIQTFEVPIQAVQRNDDAVKNWVPNHKPTLSTSTTDGETSSSNGDESDSYMGLGEADDPYMYPSPFVIKNTFIDCDGSRPNFDEFYRERVARSCPASKLCVGVDAADDVLEGLPTRESSQVPVLFDGDMPSKNTFVHFPVQHISLDTSEERRTKSCPSSGVEMADGERQVHAENTTVQTDYLVSAEETPMGFAQCMEFMMDDGVMTNLQADLYFPGAVMPMDEQFMQMMWVGAEPTQSSRPVLSLAEALPEPELGSPDMPSVGSAGHWNGTCKPCAFMARGCTSGVDCPFCHLCDMNEKKRRRKDKISFMRELRRWKKEQAAGASADQHM
jgi:hypothetical protein